MFGVPSLRGIERRARHRARHETRWRRAECSPARDLGFERATGGGDEGARAFGDDVALLVIDVQNDFVPPCGSLVVDGGDEIVAKCSEAVEAFERVVYAQDYHPEVRERERRSSFPEAEIAPV